MEPNKNLKRTLVESGIFTIESKGDSKLPRLKTAFNNQEIEILGSTIIPNTPCTFDHDVIDCWYNAAKSHFLTNERMALYLKTEKAAAALSKSVTSYETGEITLEVFGQFFLGILDTFAAHNEEDTRAIGEWVFYNSYEIGNMELKSAYQAFNLLSQAINSALKIPELKCFISRNRGNEWYIPITAKLNPRPYNKLIILVAQSIFNSRKIGDAEALPPNEDVRGLILSLMNMESLIPMAKSSKKYLNLCQNTLVEKLNKNMNVYNLKKITNFLGKKKL